MPIFIKKVLIPILAFVSLFIITLNIISDRQGNEKATHYTLKSYKNTVALYEGEKILKIYDSIVLNTLPQKDILNFNKGIFVKTQQQAEKYIEDFE